MLYFADVWFNAIMIALDYYNVHRDSGRVIGNRYGAGSGPIWLYHVHCGGTETSIADCRHDTWGVSNCQHIEDVSISCNDSSGNFIRFYLLPAAGSLQFITLWYQF